MLASHHGVPFYVASPTSTVDVGTKSGEDIRIEERPAEELEACGCPVKKRVPPKGKYPPYACSHLNAMNGNSYNCACHSMAS